MITKTAKRNTVTTTVVSPIPITAIRIGTSAEIGALMKILTHRPRIFPRLATLAMSTPIGMPTSSASVIPSANERSEINTAALNFAVGMMVIPAAITPEKGGTMVDSLARPTISQTTNHANSEKRIGIFLPNRIISIHEFQNALESGGQIASQTRPEGGAGRKRTLLSTLRTGDDRERSMAPQVVPRYT